MSVKSQYMLQGGEHWAAGEGAEDEDLIVYLIPPLPTYAAPPPPTGEPESPRKPAESAVASMPVKHVATLYEKAAPMAETQKPAPNRLTRGQAPSIPARPLPSTPGSSAALKIPPKRPRSGSFGDQPLEAASSRPVPPKPLALPALPKGAPPKVPANATPARAHSISATMAALPSFEQRNKFGSVPPLPATAAPPKPTKTQLDLSVKPALLVPVLPSLPGANTSPRETGPHSAPSSTAHSPRSTFQSLPVNLNSAHGLIRAPNSLPRTESAAPSSITAPSRPSLRIDDSISDNRVIQEIVITHEDYVKDLRSIRTVFAVPMKERSLVSAEVHKIFFEGIDELIRVEEYVLQDMMGRKGLQPLDIANLFDSHLKNLQVYIPFCARQDQTLKLMTEQLTTNPTFASFCDEVRKDPNCRGLSFDAFIIKPLQRFCKLPLLFREVLKSLAEGNTEERRRLEATQLALEKILDEINASTGAAEKLIELERNLIKKYPQIESLNLQHRKLLIDGEIAWVVKQTKDQAKLRLGHFWLLDQLLLFCRSPKELDFIMPLNTVSISRHLPAVQNFPFVFELSDMTAQGLVTRKLCLSDRDLYNNLLTKLS
jgi:hypothetical protein